MSKSLIAATGGPGDGLWFSRHTCRVTNRSGGSIALGEVVAFNHAQAGSDVDNNTPGSSDADGNNSGYNTVVDVAIATDAHKGHILAVCLETMADNAVGEVLLRGRVLECAVATATVAGDCLTPANNGELVIATGATDLKIVAIAEGVDASNLGPVLFDGIHGFGWDVAT